MTRRRSSYGEAYWAGYERGVHAGHAAGYAEGLAVLDDAADALAQLRPSRTVEMLAARKRMAEAAGPALTPREIRTRAAASWGLPVPADLADPTDHTTDPPTGATATADQTSAVNEPQVAELADDDDWAWQL